jgi:dTDP-4-amino-4,6-dideoxygalactose transaminase
VMQFIDLNAQYNSIKERIDRRVNAVLNHGKYILGPEVEELEQRLADYVGVKHCVSCGNGTDALNLSLMALRIGKGDGVLCPTFTFFATGESIAMHGASPVFVDSDASTYNICPIDLERKIVRTLEEGVCNLKAIVSVDLFGLPANYPAIRSIAEKYGLLLIEDGAQGFGGSINGEMACSFGDVATTSFFPAKPLGCYGDGGAIFTNNTDVAKLLISLRFHGKGDDKYDNVRIGMNSRLDTIQAAILLEKLAIFEDEILIKNKLADQYSEKFGQFFDVPTVPQGYRSSWAQYTLTTSDRDAVSRKFELNCVPTMVYYPKCLHQQTAFKACHVSDDDLPVASSLSNRVLSLPMHAYLDADDVNF